MSECPLVSGVSPNEGLPGTKVTIRGENLGSRKEDVTCKLPSVLVIFGYSWDFVITPSHYHLWQQLYQQFRVCELQEADMLYPRCQGTRRNPHHHLHWGSGEVHCYLHWFGARESGIVRYEERGWSM